jgi:SAM-dependent methyltransferase
MSKELPVIPTEKPKLYHELADWWPLLSAPEDYAEEAAVYGDMLLASGARPLRTVLELGSGGGNNASHMKSRFELTLVELSPGMVEVSRRLNPECEHHQGDMRTVRLGRQFDGVFIHDAICYMATIDDLRRAMETAFVHCRPGGVALFAPDYVKETFDASTEHGGHDGDDRALRYLEWCWDPDPDDTSYVADYVYALREGTHTRVVHDRHIEGLFTRQAWLDTMVSVGFSPEAQQFAHSEIDRPLDIFVGLRGQTPRDEAKGV